MKTGISQTLTLWVTIAVSTVVVALQFTLSRPWMAHILGDELRYARDIEVFSSGNSEVAFPNFLFYSMMHLSTFFNFDDYVAQKLTNSVFWLATVLVVAHYVAKSGKLTIGSGVLIVGLSLSPIAIYAQALMPEAIFMFLVTIGILFATRIRSYPARTHTFAFLWLGIIFGLASLMKVHAIFPLVALVVYFALYVNERDTMRRFGNVSAILIGFMATKLGIGFLLAGDAGLTVFGRAYENAIIRFFTNLSPRSLNTESVSNQSPLDSAGTISNEILHSSVASGFLLPLTFIAAGYLLLLFGKSPQYKINSTGEVRSVLEIVVLVAGAAFLAFTLLVTALGDDHSDRLLFRYMEIFIPAAIGLFLASDYAQSRSFKFILPASALLAIWIFSYEMSLPDSTVFFSLSLLGGLAILPAIFWVVPIVSDFLGPEVKKISLAAALIITGATVFYAQSSADNLASDYKNASSWVSGNLNSEALNSMAILGASSAINEATIFQIGKLDLDHLVYSRGEIIESTTVPSDIDVLLLLDDIELNAGTFEQYQGDGFKIAFRVPINTN